MKSDMHDHQLTPTHLDQLRRIDGFPIGEDADIIALSDPLYYTARPIRIQ